MLARLLLREHFQISGSYFLPLTNIVILLDSYCGLLSKRLGFFLLGSQTRKCENKHLFPSGADGRSFVQSVYGQLITKFSWMGTIYLPMVLRRRARELRYN